MQYQNIVFGIEAGIATLTLNRPDKLNSFTQAMHEEVRDAMRHVQQDGSVRVLVLAAAGRGFCAGQDLSDRAVAPGAPAVDLVSRSRRIMRRWCWRCVPCRCR